MQLPTLLVSLAVLSVASAQTPNGPCATGVHLIAAAGSNSTDEFALSRFAPTVQAIVGAVPGSDYVSLPYNKVQPTQNKLYPDAVPNGVSLSKSEPSTHAY